MKLRSIFGRAGAFAAALGVLIGLSALAVHAQEQIDFNKARMLLMKLKAGEKLTPDEEKYLERAKAEKAKGTRPDGKTGAPIADAKVLAGLKPLTELGAADKYKGEDGGLYGGGKNEPPEPHAAIAKAAAGKVVPLDAEGKPAAGGKIVMVSIGMSNTTQEFSVFKRLADADSARNPNLVIVDGAQGGQAALQWAGAEKRPWEELNRRIGAAGVTPAQVQVAFVKQAEVGQGRYGEFPKHVEYFQGNLQTIVQLLKQKFPNLKLVYLSSRIYAGYAGTTLNPEPFAYEGAFAVRRLIQEQIKGNAALNHDPAKGEVKTGVLLWGAYLWAAGTTPRKSDGLMYERADLAGDGTHPSDSGRRKVAEVLLKFFKSDPTTKSWFTKG
jgi:hypothetical protein